MPRSPKTPPKPASVSLRVVPNAIDEQYCRELIAGLSAHLTPAMFWTNGKRVHDPAIRDAYNYKWNDPRLSEITRTIVSDFSGETVDASRVEPTEIVCYPPGNGNERHLDGPHRSHSLVYFLNDGYAGGDLVFDDGRQFHNLPIGSAVVWENGPDAWHACAPVTRGFKWILVSWVRRPDALDEEQAIHARLEKDKKAAAAKQAAATRARRTRRRTVSGRR